MLIGILYFQEEMIWSCHTKSKDYELSELQRVKSVISV